MSSLFVKKGDNVKVLSGKDKGKTGKVLRVFPRKKRVVVEHINFVKKHERPTQENPKGGILEVENPVNIDNLMVICNNCQETTRVGKRYLSDGTKVRFCKKCQEEL